MKEDNNTISISVEDERLTVNPMTDLFDSNERLILAVKLCGAATWTWDRTTDQFVYSEEFCEMLGYDADELDPSWETFLQLQHPDDWPVIEDRFLNHKNTGTRFYLAETRLKMKSGIWKWVSARGKLIIDSKGSIKEKVIGVVLDLTDRKKKEAELVYLRENLEQEVEFRTKELQQKHDELEKKRNQIKELQAIVRICSKCRSIHDDDGYCEKIENYFESHSRVKFSHGLCKECAEKLYANEPWFQSVIDKLKNNTD